MLRSANRFPLEVIGAVPFASLLGVLLGLGLLFAGGVLMVRGASQIAAALGISPMVIGLTVVGFGTSAPELVVNITSALRGQPGLAFGNVVGSNIANLSLVLGAAAVFQAVSIRGTLVRREVPLLLLATTSIMVMALDGLLDGGEPLLSRSDGMVLLLLFGIFIYITALDFLRSRREDALLENIESSQLVASSKGGRLAWPLAISGLILLGLGGEVTIDQGVELAGALGVSPAIIGLFVVALGTSMPELVTSTIAAMQGESDLALGNVVGSNLFNSLLVLPITSLISPIAIPPMGVADLLISWCLAGVMIPVFLFGKAQLGRIAGIALLAGYVLYALARTNIF